MVENLDESNEREAPHVPGLRVLEKLKTDAHEAAVECGHWLKYGGEYAAYSVAMTLDKFAEKYPEGTLGLVKELVEHEPFHSLPIEKINEVNRMLRERVEPVLEAADEKVRTAYHKLLGDQEHLEVPRAKPPEPESTVPGDPKLN